MSDAAARPPLAFHTKVSYGLGSVAQSVAGLALSTGVINFFLIRVIGMNPVVVGVVILVSLVIDAVLDPVIGRVSDTFRSPWGRRHPFMYASALPIAVSIILLWHPPHGLSNDLLAAYMLAMLVVLRLCTSLYQVPSDALTPELAPDYHERTSLISYRYFFGVVGSVAVSVILLSVFLRKSPANPLGQMNREAYGQFFLFAAAIVFFSIIASSLATQRYIPFLRAAPQRKLTLGQTAREILKTVTNPSLLVIMTSGLFSGVAAGIGASLSFFMNFYFWGLSGPVIAVIVASTAPAAILGIVIAPPLSRALDKKWTMMTVFFMSIFSGVVPVALRLLGVLPPNGSRWIPIILIGDGFVAATLAIVGFVIVSSMIADIVEDNAVKTGQRSEGLLFAANGLLPKFTNGIGSLLGNLMIAFVHLPPGAATGADVVSPHIMRQLVLLSLPSAMLLNITAVSVLFFYRIDKRAHESNLAALALQAGLGGPPPTAVPGGAPQIEPTPLGPTI